MTGYGGAGNMTMNTANRTVFSGTDNTSQNINEWSMPELQNFVKWFIEVNYPDAVKQYQAIRAIERLAEEAAKVEADLRMEELLNQYRANQARGMQNAYPFPLATQQGYGIAVQAEPPVSRSIFDVISDGIKHWKNK